MNNHRKNNSAIHDEPSSQSSLLLVQRISVDRIGFFDIMALWLPFQCVILTLTHQNPIPTPPWCTWVIPGVHQTHWEEPLRMKVNKMEGINAISSLSHSPLSWTQSLPWTVVWGLRTVLVQCANTFQSWPQNRSHPSSFTTVQWRYEIVLCCTWHGMGVTL